MARDSIRYSIILLTAFIFSAVGCTVKVPSNAEQAKLVEQGAFPNGVPAWVSAPVAAPREDATSIPQTVRAPLVQREARQPLEQLGQEVLQEQTRGVVKPLDTSLSPAASAIE